MEHNKSYSAEGAALRANPPKTHDVSPWVVWGFGFYFIALSFLLFYLILKVWAVGDTPDNPVIFLADIRLTIGNEAKLMLLAALAGALGSLVHAMTSFATYIGNRSYVTSWNWWYILRPFIGMVLALISYFTIRGGFFTLTADTTAVNQFGVTALGGLAGMFSRQAIDKLKELFESIFKTSQPEHRVDKVMPGEEN